MNNKRLGDVMKKNKIISFVIILLIAFVTLMYFSNTALALDVASNPDKFKPGAIGSEPKLEKKIGPILGAINVFGVVVSVITLIGVGIKYMLGSVEEKAEYKNTLGMYLLGAFLVFSISTLPNIIYNISSSTFK